VPPRRLHLKRYQQIIGVLVRNGFGLLLEQLGVFGYLRMRHRPVDPNSAAAAENARRSVGERLRCACEELGPTFVKIGQILSTRPDIFSPEIAGELEKLQDAVNPFPFADARKVIETEFKEPLDQIFAWIDEKPLASASLSQVHKAGLPTGQTVVVKVQRPDIQPRIQVDLEILKDLVGFVSAHSQYGQYYDFAGMTAELERTLTNELDFRKEGENADRFRKNFAARGAAATGPDGQPAPAVRVPVIRWIYTTSRVLTMEYIEGIRISEIDALKAAGINLTDLGIRLCQDMILQVLQDGFFHADPHPGNLSIQPDGSICYLDLGMVGKLNDARKKALSNLFVGLASQDSHRVADAIVDLDTVRHHGSLRRFEHEVDRLMEEYLSRSISEIQVGELIAEIFQLAFRHHIQIPAEMTLIAKVLITLQGITEKLDPDINLLVIMQPLASRLLRNAFDLEDISRSALRSLNEYKLLVQKAPTLMLEMMHKLEENDYNLRFDLKDIDKVQKHFDRIANRLSFSVILLALALIVAGIIVGSSLSAGSDPALQKLNTAILEGALIVAVIILVGLVISMIRTKRF